uniref:CSD domain-containing protein n=3 Tax=Testudinoidea TaxID=8486 RepID=A0A452GR65_9SAUR
MPPAPPRAAPPRSMSPCWGPQLLRAEPCPRPVSPARGWLPLSALPTSLPLRAVPAPGVTEGAAAGAWCTARETEREVSPEDIPQGSGMSSEPTSSASEQSPTSPASPRSLHLPENRRTRDRSPSPMRGYLIPSPLPTRRTRTFSATVRASEGPVYKGVCKCFCRSKGHGFITPADGGPDIFVHISDIEGEYVLVAGDEVTYKMCSIPPKNEKLQAVDVVITHLAPGTKHETWSGHVISS